VEEAEAEEEEEPAHRPEVLLAQGHQRRGASTSGLDRASMESTTVSGRAPASARLWDAQA